MKTSTIATAIALASVLGGMSIAPVLARDNDDRGGRADNGRHQGWDKDRRGDRRVYRDPYYYSQPVYVPPPVYYRPQPSPGISLFFPLDFRGR